MHNIQHRTGKINKKKISMTKKGKSQVVLKND